MTDPDPADNNASDTDTLTPQADLAITKTDGVTSAVPGTPDTYTIVVSNAGPSRRHRGQRVRPAARRRHRRQLDGHRQQRRRQRHRPQQRQRALATTVDLPVNASGHLHLHGA